MAPRKKKISQAEDQLLGWRSAWGSTTAQLILEGPVDGYPDWRVSLRYVVVDDRIALAEVRVFPAADRHKWVAKNDTVPDVLPVPLMLGNWGEDPKALEGKPGITARLFQSIRIGELNKEILPLVRQMAGLPLTQWDGSDKSLGDLWSGVLAAEREKPKSAGRTNLYYAIWAARVVGKTGQKHANQELAEEFKSEEPGLTAKRVSEYTRVARDRCLYVPIGQGRAGGTLTAKARKLLENLATERTKR